MSKYKPTYTALSVFSINYDLLYAQGKRIILYDLDNTLISYKETKASADLYSEAEDLLAMGFKIYILTNNHGTRVRNFMESFCATGYGTQMNKPCAKRIRQFLKKEQITNYDEIVMIGDQLVTDILCANRLGVTSVLVKSISRNSEHFYTKINRMREPLIVKKIAKTDPVAASEIIKIISKEK